MMLPVSHLFRRALCSLFLLAALGLPTRLAFAAVPNLKLGDVAPDDIITPVPLVVLDPEATDALKEKVGQQAPSIVRFIPDAGAQAETELRKAVAGARAKFLSALDALQDHPPTAADIGTPVFSAARDYLVNNSSKNFPTALFTEMWVRGQSDAAVIDSLMPPLHEILAQPILASGPHDVPLPPAQPVRLLPVKSLVEPLLADPVESAGQPIAIGKLVSVSQAQQLARKAFPGDPRGLGDFLAEFIVPNARYDPGLTDIVRSKRIAGLAVNDTYEPAQVVIHRGQTIDRKALTALSVLREKSMIGTLQTKLDQEQSLAGIIQNQTKWVTLVLALTVVGLSLILWRLRQRPAPSLAPALYDPASASGAGENVWKERALLAEGKAERAHHAIRSGVMGWMRDKVFRTMFRQREELLSAQQSAEVEMQELEQRLEQLHAPLQERIGAYESRIKELETELAEKTRVHESAQVNVTINDQAHQEEMERRLAALSAPLQERIHAYANRVHALEQDLAASRKVVATPRSAAGGHEEVDRSVRRRELTLAEREQALGEAEQRLAERVRDLNEMDALLRARESLLSSDARTNATPTKPGSVKVRRDDPLRDFREKMGIPHPELKQPSQEEPRT
jgi:hypothetical protein